MQWHVKMAMGAAAFATLGLPVSALADETVVESFRLSDARALVTACSVPEDHALHPRANAFCLGYMTGAMQFYGAAIKSPDVDPFVCAPEDLSRASLRDAFLDWARANSQSLGEPAIEGLVRAAVAEFPCKR